jgi:hypothetical protein
MHILKQLQNVDAAARRKSKAKSSNILSLFLENATTLLIIFQLQPLWQDAPSFGAAGKRLAWNK